MAFTPSNRQWILPGAGATYYVVTFRDGPLGRNERVDPSGLHMASLIRSWISSFPSVIDDIHEAIGGYRASGLTRAEVRQHHAAIERALLQAMRTGLLVVLKDELPVAAYVKPVQEAPPPLEDDPAPEETHKVTIKLIGEDAKPVSGARFRVSLPDGSVREGRLGSTGSITFTGLPAGNCTVSFPELDEEAWEPLQSVSG